MAFVIDIIPITLLLQEPFVMCPHDAEVLDARNILIDAIINRQKKFTSYFRRNSAELVEVNATFELIRKKCIEKFINLIVVLFLSGHVVVSAEILVLVRKRVSVSSLNRPRYIFEDNPYLFSGNVLIIVDIIAPECDVHLLFQRPHKHDQKEFDKFIVIYSLIAICIHLSYKSFADQFGHIKIVLRPYNSQIIFILSLYEAEIY